MNKYRPTAKGYFSEGFCRRGIDGIYHWVSREHLQNYIDEFTLRFNTGKFDTKSRFDLVLTGVAGKKMTYEDLIK